MAGYLALMGRPYREVKWTWGSMEEEMAYNSKIQPLLVYNDEFR